MIRPRSGVHVHTWSPERAHHDASAFSGDQFARAKVRGPRPNGPCARKVCTPRFGSPRGPHDRKTKIAERPPKRVAKLLIFPCGKAGTACTPGTGRCAHQRKARSGRKVCTPGRSTCLRDARTNEPTREAESTDKGRRPTTQPRSRSEAGRTDERAAAAREHANKRQRDARQRTIRRPRPGGHDRGADASPARRRATTGLPCRRSRTPEGI